MQREELIEQRKQTISDFTETKKELIEENKILKAESNKYLNRYLRGEISVKFMLLMQTTIKDRIRSNKKRIADLDESINSNQKLLED